jgi:hypothetical protein
MPLVLPEFHSATQHQKYTFSSECTARPDRLARNLDDLRRLVNVDPAAAQDCASVVTN